jgi:hypothetical protein
MPMKSSIKDIKNYSLITHNAANLRDMYKCGCGITPFVSAKIAKKKANKSKGKLEWYVCDLGTNHVRKVLNNGKV